MTQHHGDTSDSVYYDALEAQQAKIERLESAKREAIQQIDTGEGVLKSWFEAAMRVVHAARALEQRIDLIYDVHGGRHGSPFGEEWKALRSALTAYNKEATP